MKKNKQFLMLCTNSVTIYVCTCAQERLDFQVYPYQSSFGKTFMPTSLCVTALKNES